MSVKIGDTLRTNKGPVKVIDITSKAYVVEEVHGVKEGDQCMRNGCQGIMEFGFIVPKGCYCHINPPCSHCVDNPIRCSECGATVGDE